MSAQGTDSVRRSSRKSIAPPIFDLGSTSTPASKRQKRSKVFNDDPDHLFRNSKSALVSADLKGALNQECWQLLSEEEQQTLLALLPAQDKMQSNGITLLQPSFFEHNVVLQDAMRTFQEALADGKRMPGYIKRTEAATRDRYDGKADAYKDDQYEEHWGDKH